MPPPLPPGFQLVPSAPAPAPVGGGAPTLRPLGPPHVPGPDHGYRAAPGGGETPITGGPADPRRPGGPLDPDSQLTPEAIDQQADNYLISGQLPQLGMGGAGARQRILNRAAEMARAAGQGHGDLPTQIASYRAGRAALTSQQTQLANLRSMEPTASANLDALLTASQALPGQTEQPLVNRVVHSAQRNIGLVPGHQAVSAYDVAYDTAIGEYARLISMGSSGNGQLTDAARSEAESMIPYGSSPSQLQEAIRQARIDMGNRIRSYEHTVAVTQAQLTGAPPPPAPPTTSLSQGGDVGASIPAMVAGRGAPPPPGTPPNPTGGATPPQGGGPGGGGGLTATLQSVAPPINPSGPTAPEGPQTGAIQFGVAPVARSGFEEHQVEAYDAFMRANPHATAQQIQAAFPNVSNAADIVRFRDQHGIIAPGSSWVLAGGPHDPAVAARQRAIAAAAAAQPDTISPIDVLPIVAAGHMAAHALGGDESGNAYVRGATDTFTMGTSDEAAAALNSSLGSGTYDENVATARGIADYDSQNHPISRFAGQFAAGTALPIGESPTLTRLALAGGGYGAAYGFGSGEGVADRLVRAGEGGVAGAALPPILAGAGQGASATFRALRGLVSGRSGAVADAGGPTAQDLIGAANRQNVDVLPADVSGPGIRRVTAGMAQLPFGSGPIINAAQRTTDQVGARVGEIAAAEGAPARQEALGTVARAAAQGYIDRSGAEGTRLYDAARAAASDATTSGTGAMGAIDSHIAELSSTASTSAPEISALQRLRSDIADEVKPASQAPTGVLDAQGNPIMRATEETGGPRAMSIDALRRLRTNVRAMSMEEGLRGTDFQRRANDVLSHLSDDISQGLPPEAAGAFREADAHWAHRLNVIDDVMSNIIGPQGSRSPEQVTQRLVSMSRSDSGRLKTFIDHATDEEGGVIRSSLINELGRAPSGQQGAQGDKFSLSTFLTNWDKLPERSRNIMFRGDSRAAIEDLATVAEGSREAGKYANRSNTGGAVNTGDIMRGLSVYSAWGSAGASAIVENLTGRLLASPRFARWLAKPAADGGTRMRRLAQIAAREPQLAADILPIQQALETTTRSAAAQQEDDRR